MDNKARKFFFRQFFFFFIMINSVCLLFGKWLDEKKIDHIVLMGANLLLFITFLGSALMHIKAAQNKNPNVFIRSVMGASFIKLILLAIAACVYILVAGKEVSVYAVFSSMFLYIIYTLIEKKGLAKLQAESRDGKN